MNSVLPPHLRGTKHWDWPWPFSLIPRAWTAFGWGVPSLVRGNHLRPQDFEWCPTVLRDDGKFGHFAPLPITSPGTWQLSRFTSGPWYAWYFAWSGKRQKDGKFRHIRFGARWDNVDDYVQFPAFASRRYTGEDTQDTGTA